MNILPVADWLRRKCHIVQKRSFDQQSVSHRQKGSVRRCEADTLVRKRIKAIVRSARTANVELDIWPFFDQPPRPPVRHTVLAFMESSRATATAERARGIGYECVSCDSIRDAARLLSMNPELLIIQAVVDGGYSGSHFAEIAQLTLPDSKYVIVREDSDAHVRPSDFPTMFALELQFNSSLLNRISEQIGPPADVPWCKEMRWWQYAEVMRGHSVLLVADY